MNFKKAIFVFFSGTAASVFVAFAQNILIARSLSLDDYAKFVTIISICFFGTALITFRTSEAFLAALGARSNTQLQQKLNQIFTLSILSEAVPRILLCVVLLLVSPSIVNFTVLTASDIGLLRIAFLIVLLNSTSEIWYALARADKRITEIAFFELTFSILAIFLIYMLSVFSAISLKNITLIIIFAALLKFIFQFIRIIYLVQTLKLNLSFAFKELNRNHNFILFKSTMVSGYFMSAIQSPLKYGDILIANFFMNSNEIALYKIGKSIFTVIQTVPNLITKLLFYDFVVYIKNDNTEKIRKILVGMFIVSLILFILFIVSINMIGPFIFEFIFGSSYIDSVKFLQAFLMFGGLSVILPWTVLFSIANETYARGVRRYALFQICLYVVIAFCLTWKDGLMYAQLIGLSWSLLFLTFFTVNVSKLSAVFRGNLNLN